MGKQLHLFLLEGKAYQIFLVSRNLIFLSWKVYLGAEQNKYTKLLV